MRKNHLVKMLAAYAVLAVSLAWADDASRSIAIPAGDLQNALELLMKQTGVELVYRPEQVAGLKTRGAHGALSDEAAVAKLLEGTSLVLNKDASGAILISPRTSQLIDPVPSDGGQSGKEGKIDSSNTFRLAQGTLAQPAGAAPVSATEGSSTDTAGGGQSQLQEVVVTAQKRTERLQDVPVPVTAISADTLLDNGQQRLQDYYASVPSLNLTTDARGNASLAIRGITTGVGGGNPTVSVTIDDVPFGSSSTYGGIIQPVPDLDPSELARVEVLRGPQGTLYGASSIGGLVKYVTADPSTSSVSGRLQADLNTVHNGDGAGYGLRGAINVPLTDSLAVRVSGFTRHDPGYIDNIVSSESGINAVNTYGGHLAALWHVSDEWSIKVSALFQETRADGTPTADPSLGDLKQSNIPGTGHSDVRAQTYSATVTGRIAGVDVTSVTGYGRFTLTALEDYTPVLGGDLPYVQPFFGPAGAYINGVTDDERASTNKFSQEIRAAIPLRAGYTWLLGVFYTHEQSQAAENWLAANSTSGEVFGNFLLGEWPTTFKEYATFTDFTAQITDRIEAQLGGRYSKNKQTYSEIDGGNFSPIFLGVPGPVVQPQVDTDDSSFTYLATLKYKFSPNLMTYVRLASGYRPGGSNSDCLVLKYSCQFGPDRTKNYEVGIKGQTPGQSLRFDASVFYIDWRDIQLQTILPSGAFYINGSRAKSQGAELSLAANPAKGLTISAVASWTDAVLREALPVGSVGEPGDRLPNSARFSGNLSVEQEFPLWTSMTGFVGVAANYVGDRVGIFLSAPGPRQLYPSYVQTDIRSGVRMNAWTVSLNVTNLTDQRGELGGGLGQFTPGFTYIQPRTLGLALLRSF